MHAIAGRNTSRAVPVPSRSMCACRADAPTSTAAGIVSAWPDPAVSRDDPDRWLLSMAVITRDAHVAPGEVHDRMPACLTPEAAAEWLDDDLPADAALALLEAESLDVAHRLDHYEVSRDANSVRNNGPGLIRPLP